MRYVREIFAKSYLKLVIVLSIILISKAASGSMIDNKASDFETPIANFETLQSSTTEKYGEITLEVTFSHDFAGAVHIFW